MDIAPVASAVSILDKRETKITSRYGNKTVAKLDAVHETSGVSLWDPRAGQSRHRQDFRAMGYREGVS